MYSAGLSRTEVPSPVEGAGASTGASAAAVNRDASSRSEAVRTGDAARRARRGASASGSGSDHKHDVHRIWSFIDQNDVVDTHAGGLPTVPRAHGAERHSTRGASALSMSAATSATASVVAAGPCAVKPEVKPEVQRRSVAEPATAAAAALRLDDALSWSTASAHMAAPDRLLKVIALPCGHRVSRIVASPAFAC